MQHLIYVTRPSNPRVLNPTHLEALYSCGGKGSPAGPNTRRPERLLQYDGERKCGVCRAVAAGERHPTIVE